MLPDVLERDAESDQLVRLLHDLCLVERQGKTRQNDELQCLPVDSQPRLP
jgi:hypothetical protein